MEKVLNQILTELQSLNQRVGGLEQCIGNLEHGQQQLKQEFKADIQKVESKVDKLELRMENEVIDKIRALFDDRSMNHDYFASIKDSLARIEDRVDFLARQNIEHLENLRKYDRELRLLRAERK